MTPEVKRQSGRRAEKAQATRQRMLDTALELFVEVGYAATTIAAIAEAADVAVQTVYAVFGNKRTILTELLTRAVVGDDAPGALRDRAEWQAMEQQRDPRLQLTELATIAAGIGARMAPLYEVMSAAAGSDPEIAELFRAQQAGRYDDQQRVARSLARRHALRDGMSAREATDVLWTIASPRTYHSLVNERGWERGAYERWLADVLVMALLGELR